MAESTQKDSKNVTAPTPWPVATLIILAILDMAICVIWVIWVIWVISVILRAMEMWAEFSYASNSSYMKERAE